MVLKYAAGTPKQREMVQDALNRYWWPSLMMLGPHDAESPNTAQLMKWGVKTKTNDEVRQEFIAETAPDTAQQIIERIDKSLQSLQQFPEMGRIGRVNQTRELVIPRTPFILPYRIRQNHIEILAVLHGARRWPDTF